MQFRQMVKNYLGCNSYMIDIEINATTLSIVM
jgi:hypothetical protein